MYPKHINAGELKQRAKGRWVEILSGIVPELSDAVHNPRRHFACPVHGGKDGFRALKKVAELGGTLCNTCGKQPDGFATIAWVTGWSFRQTLEEVDNFLGGLSYSTAIVRPAPVSLDRTQEEDDRVRASLRTVMSGCISLTHSDALPARLYFQRRCIPLPKRNVGFHRSLIYRDEDGKFIGRYPGLVSLIHGPSGTAITLHRTFLTPDGQKLSDRHPQVSDSRKMMSLPNGKVLDGAAIRLSPIEGNEMGVGEGLETAASGEVLFDVPSWAAANSWMLETFEPPEGIQTIHIFADKDASGGGQASAAKLAERMSTRGINAIIHLPDLPIPEGSKGVDWNNVLRAKQFA